jgi:hypothetical protein
MLSEIKGRKNQLLSDNSSQQRIASKKEYKNLFDSTMVYNDRFVENKVDERFNRATYGRQFFINEKEADLTNLFDQARMKEDLPFVGAYLAKRGVLTPTMIRYLKPESIVFDDDLNLEKLNETIAYDKIISSIEKPEDRLFFSVTSDGKNTSLCIGINDQTGCDLLSPPTLLSLPYDAKAKSKKDLDSMGAFTNNSSLEVEKYGGAILEIRGLSNAIEPTDRRGYFLSKTDKLKDDMLKFFSVLTSIE